MKKTQMVDLKSQYNNIKEEVDKAVIDVIESTAFINGPAVKDFEKEFGEYLGVKNVIACANGTDALQVALMALDLKPGDEVITSDFTFVSSVEMIELLGLKTILVDVEPDTFNIDPDKIEAAITNKTKAIIPVHLFGQCANMDRIMEIAKKNNLYVIEDSAQAIGATHKSENGTHKAGTIGHIGTTSFFPSKNLGCYGDGGAIYTNDNELTYKIRGLVNHGMYERYHYKVVGINSRLDSIQAAILRVKLKHIDSYNENRRKAAHFYTNAFSKVDDLICPLEYSKSYHVYHQYTLKVKNGKRDALKNHLDNAGIPNAVYYPIPLHKQEAYTQLSYKEEDFMVSNSLSKEVLSLPMHSELDDEQLEHITKTILSFFNA